MAQFESSLSEYPPRLFKDIVCNSVNRGGNGSGMNIGGGALG